MRSSFIQVHGKDLSLRKRAFDVCIGLTLGLLLTPIMILLAIGSALAYRAWPFFVQDRLGLHGRSFRFVKVRSLPDSTHCSLDKHQLQHVGNNAWGRWLRKFHLDEVPQLWLVVTGRMSLVGPRPEMPSLAATFDQEFVRERLTTAPGCTGLWQISPSSALLIGEDMTLDLHYVRNWTLRLDVWILFRTVEEMVGGRSLTDLSQIPKWTGASLSVAIVA